MLARTKARQYFSLSKTSPQPSSSYLLVIPVIQTLRRSLPDHHDSHMQTCHLPVPSTPRLLSSSPKLPVHLRSRGWTPRLLSLYLLSSSNSSSSRKSYKACFSNFRPLTIRIESFTRFSIELSRISGSWARGYD